MYISAVIDLNQPALPQLVCIHSNIPVLSDFTLLYAILCQSPAMEEN